MVEIAAGSKGYQTPTLSVCMATFNHEKYIRQAVESVVAQKTSFPLELIVGEDCSTDETRNILVELAREHPEIVKPVFREGNVGAAMNFRGIYNVSSGQFVALLDGDDYWTFAGKLQNQVDYLRKNSAVSCVFHNVRVEYDDATEIAHPFIESTQRSVFELSDVLRHCFLPTCSVVFRRANIPKMPAFLDDLMLGDWAIHCMNAVHGTIHYLDETWGCYRVHDGGAWSVKPDQHRCDEMIRACRIVGERLKLSRHRDLRVHLARLFWQKFRRLASDGQRVAAMVALLSALQHLPLSEYPRQTFRKLLAPNLPDDPVKLYSRNSR